MITVFLYSSLVISAITIIVFLYTLILFIRGRTYREMFDLGPFDDGSDLVPLLLLGLIPILNISFLILSLILFIGCCIKDWIIHQHQQKFKQRREANERNK